MHDSHCGDLSIFVELCLCFLPVNRAKTPQSLKIWKVWTFLCSWGISKPCWWDATISDRSPWCHGHGPQIVEADFSLWCSFIQNIDLIIYLFLLNFIPGDWRMMEKSCKTVLSWGNAWEWTEDHFNPLEGFEVHYVWNPAIHQISNFCKLPRCTVSDLWWLLHALLRRPTPHDHGWQLHQSGSQIGDGKWKDERWGKFILSVDVY